MLADFDNRRQLADTDKLELIGLLGDDLSVSREPLPMSAALKDELIRRIAEIESDPTATISREELWRQVDERRG